jgi:hypothetical protein
MAKIVGGKDDKGSFDNYSRLLNFLLLVWPGQTCLFLKSVLDDKRFNVAIAVADIFPMANKWREIWLNHPELPPLRHGSEPKNDVNVEESIYYWAKTLNVKPNYILEELKNLLNEKKNHEQ